jgi:hypothetical protein
VRGRFPPGESSLGDQGARAACTSRPVLRRHQAQADPWRDRRRGSYRRRHRSDCSAARPKRRPLGDRKADDGGSASAWIRRWRRSPRAPSLVLLARMSSEVGPDDVAADQRAGIRFGQTADRLASRLKRFAASVHVCLVGFEVASQCWRARRRRAIPRFWGTRARLSGGVRRPPASLWALERRRRGGVSRQQRSARQTGAVSW